MNTYRIVWMIVGLGVVVGAFVVTMGDPQSDRVTTTLDPTITEQGNATVEGDVQYIDITARAGYSPRVTYATKGMQTIIRMHTDNTYDCSSALVIPAIRYQTSLKPTGTVEIPIAAEVAEGTLEGLCSMGMYRFSIVFE